MRGAPSAAGGANAGGTWGVRQKPIWPPRYASSIQDPDRRPSRLSRRPLIRRMDSAHCPDPCGGYSHRGGTSTHFYCSSTSNSIGISHSNDDVLQISSGEGNAQDDRVDCRVGGCSPRRAEMHHEGAKDKTRRVRDVNGLRVYSNFHPGHPPVLTRLRLRQGE